MSISAMLVTESETIPDPYSLKVGLDVTHWLRFNVLFVFWR